jgi:hypothetical protein
MRHSPRVNAGGFDSYDYSDITKDKFISKRSCNPLEPSYMGRDEDGNLVNMGEVRGSKPTALPPNLKDPSRMPSTALRSDDIMGGTANTKGMGVFAENHTRKDYREINKISDIEGAGPGTLKKGPVTIR